MVSKAIEARESSYSPYSNFKVGAALLTFEGEIILGSNIESAAYSPTICAERTAFSRAVADGHKNFKAIAVVGASEGEALGFCYPCGVCRQVMMEFCSYEKFLVIVATSPENYKIHTLEELLPYGFGPDDLRK